MPVTHVTELLDQEEACRALHCSRTTLWRLDREGHIQSARIGARRCYTAESIDAYIRSQLTGK